MTETPIWFGYDKSAPTQSSFSRPITISGTPASKFLPYQEAWLRATGLLHPPLSGNLEQAWWDAVYDPVDYNADCAQKMFIAARQCGKTNAFNLRVHARQGHRFFRGLYAVWQCRERKSKKMSLSKCYRLAAGWWIARFTAADIPSFRDVIQWARSEGRIA